MDELKNLVLLIGSGFLFRTALIYTGQLWAKSHAQTVSFLVLPLITYVITNTIANNIALSLGMIGALSIVRFRHPVKSPLELIMYFALKYHFFKTIISINNSSYFQDFLSSESILWSI